MLRADTRLRVHVNLNGLPEPEIPYHMRPSDKDDFAAFSLPPSTPTPVGMPHPSSLPAILGRMFRPSIISSLATDRSIDWPKPGNLSVEYHLTTPLYCTIATNGRVIKQNQADLQAGLTTEVIQPVFECSEENVEWALRLADEGCSASYRGLWPSVVSIH